MHRRSYDRDPALCERVFDSLETWLPGLRERRLRAEALGWRWERVSTPFVYEREGRILSHVGLLDLTLVCHGRERAVGGIHAVCTLESQRRRGLYRALMEEVLAFCDERYATLELTTANPEFYEPFGFRHIPEQRFVTRVHSRPGRPGIRRLDLAKPADRSLLEERLAQRAPVSRSFGVLRDRDVFGFNMAESEDLYECENLDAILVLRQPGPGADRLELLDVVAPEIPPLDLLLQEIPAGVREVRAHFDPEPLGSNWEPEPLGPGDALMVRGEFPFGPGELPAGMLPPTSRH